VTATNIGPTPTATSSIPGSRSLRYDPCTGIRESQNTPAAVTSAPTTIRRVPVFAGSCEDIPAAIAEATVIGR
jgi:hypothetical protein